MSHPKSPRHTDPFAAFPQLREEVQQSVKTADVSRRYFRMRARRLRQLSTLFMLVAAAAAIVGVVAASQGQTLIAALALVLVFGTMCAPALLRLDERRSCHLVAHARAIDASAAWARLVVDSCSPATSMLRRNLHDARRASKKLEAVSPQTRDVGLWETAERAFDHALP